MPRILVVEDNAAVRYIVVRLLATAGYDVTETATAKDALQAWHEGGIDLVLTDVSLPDMNGFEMILQIRAHAPGYPIIAMSGRETGNCSRCYIGLSWIPFPSSKSHSALTP